MDYRKRGLSRWKDKGEVAAVLRKSWYHLRLSVRHPSRVPTWDAIVLTAASPEQAELYEWQLARAKRIGRIALSTVTLVVPDPDGARIGSGAATINALSALIRHFSCLHLTHQPSWASANQFTSEVSLMSVVDIMSKKHILLLHAGGDSKRVPWANPMGKIFLPFPYLAADDPDSPVPLLFDHILAVASCAMHAFKNEGGILIMTGDVVPCFDAATLVLPDDAPCIITVPSTLDIASNHGVVVASRSEDMEYNCSFSLVDNLLQKPSADVLKENQAVGDDGRAFLDTGIIAIRGKVWQDLLMLTDSTEMIILGLLQNETEARQLLLLIVKSSR